MPHPQPLDAKGDRRLAPTPSELSVFGHHDKIAGCHGFLAPTLAIAAVTLAAEYLVPPGGIGVGVIFSTIIGVILYLMTGSFGERCAVFVCLSALEGRGVTVLGLSWMTTDVLAIFVASEGLCILCLRPARSRVRAFGHSLLVPLAVLLCAICVLSIVFSPLPNPTITPVLRFILLVAAAICMGINAMYQGFEFDLMRAFGMQLILYVAADISDYLTGNGVYGAMGLFSSEGRLTVSNMLAFVMVISAPFLTLFRPFRSVLIGVPIWISAFVLFCLTMSRGAFLLIPIDLLLLVGLYAREKRHRRLVLTLLILGLPLCLGPLWFVYSTRISEQRAASDLERTAALAAAVEGTLSYPLHGIGFAQWIRAYELGIGSGLETFYDTGFGSVVSRNPHNAYLRAALDLGLPGFLVFSAIMLSLVLTANRLRRSRSSGDLWHGAYISLLISVINLALIGVFLDSVEAPQTWCLVGLCLGAVGGGMKPLFTASSEVAHNEIDTGAGGDHRARGSISI